MNLHAIFLLSVSSISVILRMVLVCSASATNSATASKRVVCAWHRISSQLCAGSGSLRNNATVWHHFLVTRQLDYLRENSMPKALGIILVIVIVYLATT